MFINFADCIFAKAAKTDVNDFVSLIDKRIKWMEQNGIKQWNLFGYKQRYSFAYFKREADFSGKGACFFSVQYAGISHLICCHADCAGTGSVFPHGKSGGARDKLAYNTGASLAGHSTDRSDFDREGLGKGAEYGGIPAGRSVFDHSGAPSHCGAVYRSPAVKCMDPAGAKRSVRISRLDSFTESNGKVYL